MSDVKYKYLDTHFCFVVIMARIGQTRIIGHVKVMM